VIVRTLTLLALATLAACGGASPPATGSAPSIGSFGASPATVAPGAATLLSWTVSGATSLSIDAGVGDVTGKTSTSVSPAATTAYTLTAANATGVATQTITVTVTASGGPPAIGSFGASPASIVAGASSTLSWTTSGATSLTLDHGVGDVTGKLSTAVSPAATTTYTLTAANALGSVTATAQITVVPATSPPVIASYTANPASVIKGASTTLSWSVKGAASIQIDQGVGDVAGATSTVVAPTVTTTYTLTATNLAGSRKATLQVVVQSGTGTAPVISSFAASPSSVAAGLSTQLSWVVQGATSLAIDNSVGAVTGSAATVSPGATTTYTLTATNAFGSSTAAATVAVSPGGGVVPVIASFTATPDTVTKGSSATLAWSVTGATSIALDNGVSAGTGSSVKVSPGATTIYTLTAANAAGSVIARITVNVNGGAGSAPSIAGFTADPASIALGASSSLTWSVSGATDLSIDNGVGVVTRSNTVQVSPVATTTYTLTATNGAGRATASITVTVTGAGQSPPVIKSFTASPSSISAGSKSLLAWTIDNSTSISIDQGIGKVTGSQTPIAPTTTTTYTLTATNANGTSHAAATVTVSGGTANPPNISTFVAQPATIAAGGTSALSWSVSGATFLSIDGGVGPVTPVSSGSVTVKPATTTTYTLSAQNGAGTTTAQATVTVNASLGAFVLSYTDPPAGGKLRLVVASGSGSAHLQLDLVVGAAALTGTGVAMNLPLNESVAFTPSTGLLLPASPPLNPDPAASGVQTLGAALPTAGPLANILTFGLAQKKQSAAEGDVTLAAGALLCSIKLDISGTPAAGAVFTGTALPAGFRAALIAHTKAVVAGTGDFAIGTLAVSGN